MELEQMLITYSEKLERKIENTESRCKNEARKIVDQKFKANGGKMG